MVKDVLSAVDWSTTWPRAERPWFPDHADRFGVRGRAAQRGRLREQRSHPAGPAVAGCARAPVGHACGAPSLLGDVPGGWSNVDEFTDHLEVTIHGPVASDG